MTVDNAMFGGLYPDLKQCGGLVSSLQQTLRSFGASLPVVGAGMARIELHDRFSQVTTALNDRMFFFDFWDRGVALGTGRTPDLVCVAQSIRTWVELRLRLSEMTAKFSFVTPTAVAESFEEDREVEWQWASLMERIRKGEGLSDLLPFVLAARERSELSGLFPFTSHATFHLSRCTGYPYSGDCPFVVLKTTGIYEVFDQNQTCLGSGDPAQAVQILIDNLPPGSGRARKGTAENLFS